MLYVLLFTFVLSNGEVKTFHVLDAEDRDSCKQKAYMVYKAISIKPDHITCLRKA